MPELPEVETIRSGLEDVLRNKQIAHVEVIFTKSMPASTEDLEKYVIGATITDIRRRGKVLILELSSGYSLLIHLKMTGQLVFDAVKRQQAASSKQQANSMRIGGGHPTKSMAADLPDKSTRVVFTFADGSVLYFNDQRKFGWVKLVESSKVEREKFFESMGSEPLEPEFQISNFKSRMESRKAPIKVILLDQDTVAGLGNIYTDEALHLAKIHPLRQGQVLTAEEVERLHAAIITVLQDSINDGGTSFTSYVNANGITGDYLRNARVYRREGEPCPECKAAIEKIKVAQRGTHICPKCQILD